jgi:putative hemolysin
MIILILKIILILFSIIIVTVFSGGETAIASLEYKGFSEENISLSARAKNIIFLWKNYPWRILNTVLIGNNMFVILASVITASAALDFARLSGMSQTKSAFVFSTSTLILVFVFSEMVPKILARLNPWKFFKNTVGILYYFEKILTPINKIFSSAMIFSPRLFGLGKENKNKITDKDIKDFLDIGEIDGTIKAEEKDIIQSIIEFGDLTVRDVMIKRAKIDCLNISDGLDLIIDKFNKFKHSRIPIYENNFDNIIGIIYAKDLLIAHENRELLILEDILRPPYFVPPTKKVNELLREFKSGHYHMAIVVDEFGIVLGLLTIEDIIEEIVGDILDEYDVEEAGIKIISEGVFSVNPSIELSVLEKKVKINIEDEVPEDVNTLSAYLIYKLGHIPQKNESVKKDGIIFFIKDVNKNVLKEVVIYKVKK